MKICLIFAMVEEAQKTLSQYDFTHVEFNTHFTFQYYRAQVGHIELWLAINGVDPYFHISSIGTLPAALNTQLICEQIKPELIISAGTAGAFEEKGAKIGDVYTSQSFCMFHDFIIPIPGFKEYGEGKYKTYNTDQLAKKIGLKQTNISTGNSLTSIDDQLETMKTNHCNIKEMEAAAIAYVSQFYKTDFMALKSVTDLLDHHAKTQEQFLTNLELASSNLAKKIIEVIDFFNNIKK